MHRDIYREHWYIKALYDEGLDEIATNMASSDQGYHDAMLIVIAIFQVNQSDQLYKRPSLKLKTFISSGI